MQIGYTILSDNNLAKLIEKYKRQIPLPLQAHINFNKETTSLAQTLTGRYLLWRLLQMNGVAVEQITLSLSAYKRPFIEGSKWRFSIAHSGNIVVCALYDEVIPGIDIELMKEINFADFKDYFAVEEYNSILHGPLATFYQLWTAKEAISKAVGKGLYLDLQKIERIAPGQYKLDGAIWFTQEINIDPAYCCTIAAATPLHRLSLRELSTE